MSSSSYDADPPKRTTPPWIIAAVLVIVASVVIVVGVVIVLVVLLLPAWTHGDEKKHPSNVEVADPTAMQRKYSGYPSPHNTYEGRTADQWASQVNDVNGNVAEKGCEALCKLGGEGVPYLLDSIDRSDPPTIPLNMMSRNQVGRLLRSEHLGCIIDCLDDRWWKSDFDLRGSVRLYAIDILKDAGPNARPALPRLRELAAHPPTHDQEGNTPGAEQHREMAREFSRQAAEAVKTIEGR
jgi:hypothetical protein